jgi:site-specific DNA-methyltransferase (adenine-specific)
VKPYYQDSAVTIYHGDCREILPDIGFDRIITDAPYGVEVEYGQFHDTAQNVGDLATYLASYLLSCIGAAVLCGVTQMWLWPQPKWVLCWSYFPTTNQFSPWGYAQWQPVLVYGSDPYLSAGKGPRPTVFTRIRPPDKKGNDHPCPKPEDVMTWLVDRTTAFNDVILDPFMGSGTTLRATKDLGRKAIGIELEERYCEIAARRMEQEVLPFTSGNSYIAEKELELAI